MLLRVIGTFADPQVHLTEHNCAVISSGLDKIWTIVKRDNHPDIHLIPDVQQHHVILIQVILVKVCNLCRYKATRLVGALKQPGRNTAVLILKSENRRNL